MENGRWRERRRMGDGERLMENEINENRGQTKNDNYRNTHNY